MDRSERRARKSIGMEVPSRIDADKAKDLVLCFALGAFGSALLGVVYLIF